MRKGINLKNNYSTFQPWVSRGFKKHFLTRMLRVSISEFAISLPWSGTMSLVNSDSDNPTLNVSPESAFKNTQPEESIKEYIHTPLFKKSFTITALTYHINTMSKTKD